MGVHRRKGVCLEERAAMVCQGRLEEERLTLELMSLVEDRPGIVQESFDQKKF